MKKRFITSRPDIEIVIPVQGVKLTLSSGSAQISSSSMI